KNCLEQTSADLVRTARLAGISQERTPSTRHRSVILGPPRAAVKSITISCWIRRTSGVAPALSPRSAEMLERDELAVLAADGPVVGAEARTFGDVGLAQL